ncbi:hypothetical protein LCGC14_2027260 [marine sediment metagenome]|uniref:Uncharacterized protein n=1 Tax=marine sediment metagenome TaxID=412755 RepID=A0A0F9EVL2_9ZZZZ
MPPDTETEEWFQRARDTGTPIDMSVSCPKCWKPMLLMEAEPMSAGDVHRGCQCGTVATLEELKRAFGIEGVSGSCHDISRID